MTSAPLRTVVLISGRGSNLGAIVEAAKTGLPVEVTAVISNRPGAGGLDLAAAAGIPTEVVDHRAFPSREAFEAALAATIDRYDPGLVVLAGFMRVLGPAFIRHYTGRMLNIHPALLPRFPGLHTHRRALEAGEREHGASVHFVTDEVDGGPIVVQARVPVRDDDDEDTLAARVLAQEHRIYPKVIAWFAQGRLEQRGDKAYLDGEALGPGGAQDGE